MIGAVVFVVIDPLKIESSFLVPFNYLGLFSGFTTFVSQFRYDTIIVIFLLPLIVCLFLVSKKEFQMQIL